MGERRQSPIPHSKRTFPPDVLDTATSLDHALWHSVLDFIETLP